MPQPLLLLWLTGAVFCDFHRRKVPNGLVLAGAAAALLSLATDTALPGLDWATALRGGAVAFIVLLPLYAARAMGAGDVKFAAALGLWVGPAPLLPIGALGSMLAMGHALLLLALRRSAPGSRLALALCGRGADGRSDPQARRHLPYAAYLALATLAWLAWGGGR